MTWHDRLMPMISGSRKATALLASFLAASPALAEPKAPSEKDKQFAGELVKKAIARSQAGDHAAAIEIYLHAFALVPNPLLLPNIGAEFQQSGKPQEALHYFCLYLEKDPDGTNATFATSKAKALQIQLGNKNVDDDDVCAPPRPARKPVKEPREPVKEQARDPIKDPIKEPPARQPLDEGTASPGGGSSKLKYVGLVVGLVGLGAVGVGTYDGIQAKSISDQLTNHPQNTPWPDNIKDLQRRGQAYENLQIGFLAGGVALATTGVILFVVGRSDESSRRSSDKTLVKVAPTTNGFAVLGTF
jgi:tetratricopeptide (TPR) repeat protein